MVVNSGKETFPVPKRFSLADIYTSHGALNLFIDSNWFRCHEGQFYVSNWLVYSTQIFDQTLFLMFLWIYFKNEINIFIDRPWVKHATFHNVSGLHPSVVDFKRKRLREIVLEEVFGLQLVATSAAQNWWPINLGWPKILDMSLCIIMWTNSLKYLSLWTHAHTHTLSATANSRQSCLTLCDPIDGGPPGSHPWGSLGKHTGVGCHFLLQCMKVKSESEVAHSCPTLCEPMDCSLPVSSVHGIS